MSFATECWDIIDNFKAKEISFSALARKIKRLCKIHGVPFFLMGFELEDGPVDLEIVDGEIKITPRIKEKI